MIQATQPRENNHSQEANINILLAFFLLAFLILKGHIIINKTSSELSVVLRRFQR